MAMAGRLAAGASVLAEEVIRWWKGEGRGAEAVSFFRLLERTYFMPSFIYSLAYRTPWPSL
jgi:hypothetical protein